MWKIDVKLNTRRVNSNGKYTLQYELYKDREHRYYFSTGLQLSKKEWICNRIVGKLAMYNSLIVARINAASEKLIELQMNLATDNVIRTEIAKVLSGETGKQVTFVQQAEKYIKRIKAKSSVTSVVHKIDKYYPDLTIQQIDKEIILDIASRLRNDGLQENTIAQYLNNFRTIVFSAIDDDIIQANPFRKVKIKTVPTRKRSLSLEELRSIRDYTGKYRTAADYFMIIFYAIGINTVDLCNAKEPVNGYIEYKRAKTGRLYTIKIEKELQELIDKHKGNGKLLDITKTRLVFNFWLNKNLKKMQNRTDISTYWARHTWATIAAELDIPKETIAAALGHGGNSVTDIYINFNQKKIDDANRRVIDYVNSDLTKKRGV